VPAALSPWSNPELFEGRTWVKRLPPGTWTVHAVAPDGRKLRGTVVTAPGQPARLVLE